jgi:hypothetical protein
VAPSFVKRVQRRSNVVGGLVPTTRTVTFP